MYDSSLNLKQTNFDGTTFSKQTQKVCGTGVPSKKQSIVPFLKWAGGKRWFVSKHAEILNVKYNRYIEPFLGSGSVFFHQQPENAILSDLNEDLINAYEAIQVDWEKVVAELKKHHKKHCKDYYYKIRASKPRTLYTSAAKFIYLNRTCWNGLYRVNLKGEFNVPIGTKTDVLLDTDNFKEISRLLQGIVLQKKDFEVIIEQADLGDLIFVDPPYTVKHNNNGFIKYNENLFSWNDQIRLSKCLIRAKKRGAKIIATNAYHEPILELYKEHFSSKILERYSALSGDKKFRGKVKEVLIYGV